MAVFPNDPKFIAESVEATERGVEDLDRGEYVTLRGLEELSRLQARIQELEAALRGLVATLAAEPEIVGTWQYRLGGNSIKRPLYPKVAEALEATRRALERGQEPAP